MSEYDVELTKEKFKRCIGICQDAAMKTTAPGITRFQGDKKYGTWFNKLFNVMKSTGNCHPSNLYNQTPRTMVAAVIRRRRVQTRIHQEILENKKKRIKGNYLYQSMKL